MNQLIGLKTFGISPKRNDFDKSNERNCISSRKYFYTGDEKELKPMILADIANVVNMDISTISRVSNLNMYKHFLVLFC